MKQRHARPSTSPNAMPGTEADGRADVACSPIPAKVSADIVGCGVPDNGKLRQLVYAPLKQLVILSLVVRPALGAGAEDPAYGQKILVVVKGVATPFSQFGLVKHFQEIPGVAQVHFNLLRGVAEVTSKPGAQVTDHEIRRAIRGASYTPGSITREPMSSPATRRAEIENGQPGSQP